MMHPNNLHLKDDLMPEEVRQTMRTRKIGRPTEQAGSVDDIIKIRVSQAEKEAWSRAAGHKGLTISRWLRELVNNAICVHKVAQEPPKPLQTTAADTPQPTKTAIRIDKLTISPPAQEKQPLDHAGNPLCRNCHRKGNISPRRTCPDCDTLKLATDLKPA